MRFKRLLVGALGAALLGALPVALASSPAQAGAAPASSVSGGYSSPPDGNGRWRYGQTIRFEANVMVECTAGSGAFDCAAPDEPGDSVKLQRRMNGSSTWVTVATKYDAQSTVQFATRSVGSAVYRLYYSGGTSAGYTASYSGTSPVLKGSRNPAGRAVKSSGRIYYKGNVDPGWARRYVTIQKANCASCTYRAYKTVKTNRYGGYTARIAAPRTGRWYFRSTVRGTSPRFVRGFGNVYYTYQARGRTSAAGAGMIGH